jgi:hypothetical protein
MLLPSSRGHRVQRAVLAACLCFVSLVPPLAPPARAATAGDTEGGISDADWRQALEGLPQILKKPLCSECIYNYKACLNDQGASYCQLCQQRNFSRCLL